MNLGHSNPFIKNIEQQDRLKEASLSFSDKQMQSFIQYGVGYHNGGLCQKDRNLIEGLFLRGDLQVLCTTNTLAHGVNLPAHTVVIKSTQFYNKEKGIYSEYDRSMILQMCGRAGRPPFDDTGMVVIMTRKETVHLYENLLGGCEMVESQLLSSTTEHLNAEIVQLTVPDISLAIEWLKCSYLFVRIKKNPEYYGIKKGIPWERLEKHVQEICVQNVNELAQYGMIWTDEYGFLLKPLEPGKLMTKYYLTFETMKDIVQTAENCTLEDTLRTVCRSKEIAWIQLRRNEKKLLNDVNSDKSGRLRFHVLSENKKRKKRIQTKEEKIFILVNDCLTGDPSLHDLSLNQDMNQVCSTGTRVAKCLKDFLIYKKNYKGYLNASILAKSLHRRLWDDSPYLLKQLPGIGMVTAKALHSSGISSFAALEEADPRRIEMITGRKYPFGNHIKDSLLSLPPKVEVKIQSESQRQGKSKMVITLARVTEPNSTMKRHYADMVVGSIEDNQILFHEKIRVEEFSSPYSATVFISSPQQGKVTVKADLIFEEHIGLDVHAEHMITQDVILITSTNHKSKNSRSTFVPNKEIHVVEDNDASSGITAGKNDISNFDVSHVSMPSFELLPEDMEDGVLPTETEEHGPDNFTEHTIFDHIRKKAKTFPALQSLVLSDSGLPHIPNSRRELSTNYKNNGIQKENPTALDLNPVSHLRNMSNLNNSFGTSKAVADPRESQILFQRAYPGSAFQLHEPQLSLMESTQFPRIPETSTEITCANPDRAQMNGFNESSHSGLSIVGMQAAGEVCESSSYFASLTDVSNPISSNMSKKDDSEVSELKKTLALNKKQSKSDYLETGKGKSGAPALKDRKEIIKAIIDNIFKPEDIRAGGCLSVENSATGGKHTNDIFGRYKSVFSFLHEPW